MIFCGGFRAAMHVQLLVDVHQMRADGGTADVQTIGNLLVAKTLGHQGKNLQFAGRQLIRAGRLTAAYARVEKRESAGRNRPIFQVFET